MVDVKINSLYYNDTVNLLVVASFKEIKTGYRGFETKQNPVFRMLVLCIEIICRRT